MQIRLASPLVVKGRFRLEARDREGRLVAEVDEDNLILDSGLVGLDAVMANPGSSQRYFAAISIGDKGTLLSDPFAPIEPPPTRTELYHELGSTRDALVPNWPLGLADGFTAIQQVAPDDSAVECQRIFDSTLIQVADFADATKQYLNEAMVWLGKAGDDPDVDWVPFAMRTFKSVPFGPVDAITATIRWTFTFGRGTV